MPGGWVHNYLHDGTAVVLVDGVDELSADRRDEVRYWLRDLVHAFPQARYVVTSRPSAALPTWLDGEGFDVLDLQPMTPGDVQIFVERWHSAMRAQCLDYEAKHELDCFQQSLLEQIGTRRHLRKLTGYPLLCALLCALNRDRRAAMPNNRMELFEVALQMLLERLDSERKIPSITGLNRIEKTLLLGDLAYWFIRNEISDAKVDRVKQRLSQRLFAMPQIAVDVNDVYRHLLERTGLLRQPVEGRIDFVHRTFQEYLAARSAVVESDDLGVLVNHSHSDQWHDMIVMAAGHATSTQRRELLHGLLARGDQEPTDAKSNRRETFHLLAMACLETVPELDPRLWREIEQRAEHLVPPRSTMAAKSLAAAGGFVLDLLNSVEPVDEQETIATIRALVETGLDEAIAVIARFSRDTRTGVLNELIRGWSRFDPETYARDVLAHTSIRSATISDIALLPQRTEPVRAARTHDQAAWSRRDRNPASSDESGPGTLK
jgi:hypothetical protein